MAFIFRIAARTPRVAENIEPPATVCRATGGLKGGPRNLRRIQGNMTSYLGKTTGPGSCFKTGKLQGSRVHPATLSTPTLAHPASRGTELERQFLNAPLPRGECGIQLDAGLFCSYAELTFWKAIKANDWTNLAARQEPVGRQKEQRMTQQNQPAPPDNSARTAAGV